MSNFIPWLRMLAARGGKGVVENIDARSLARIADELASMQAEIKRLRAALGRCAARLERCAIAMGNDNEVAAGAVEEYRMMLPSPPEQG